MWDLAAAAASSIMASKAQQDAMNKAINIQYGYQIMRPEIIGDNATIPKKIYKTISSECKWCGAPKSNHCCEYCRRE